MQPRLFGLEAELAVSAIRAGEALPTSRIVVALAQAAQRTLPHLSGGGSRMFLANGGLFYVDCGSHPEWATPECTTPSEAVCHLRGGERMVARLADVAREQLKAERVYVSRSNVDYLSGTTWGCHESYLGQRPITAYKKWLVPHLVSRIVYTGSGGLDPLSPGIRLSISPRVSHIDHLESAESTSARGVFHTRDESLSTGYTRIHVLAGDNACSQRATWLKVGATALIVALADAQGSRANWITLTDPVEAMKGFARDLRHRTEVELKRGSTVLMTAVEIQRWLLSRIEAHADEDRLPDWAATVCEAWKQALDLIESPGIERSHALDWPLKFALLRREIERRGFTEPVISAWSEALERLSLPVSARGVKAPCLDETQIDRLRKEGVLSGADLDYAGRALAVHGLSWWGLGEFNALRRQLCAIDVRFGELNSGIFDSLDCQNAIPDHRMVSEAQIREAEARAPEHSRARVRGHWVRRLSSKRQRYQCEWQSIRSDTNLLDLGDPFATEAEWQTSIDPYACREQAYECYRDGRYVDAEALLERVLETRFEPADIHVHLARVCLMTDRVESARTHASQAWAARRAAAPYVVARTLWTRLVVACLDATGADAVEGILAGEIASLLCQLKTALQARSAAQHWTMRPVLDHLAPRLTDERKALLEALVVAMSEGDLGAIQAIDSWRAVQAIPLHD